MKIQTIVLEQNRMKESGLPMFVYNKSGIVKVQKNSETKPLILDV